MKTQDGYYKKHHIHRSKKLDYDRSENSKIIEEELEEMEQDVKTPETQEEFMEFMTEDPKEQPEAKPCAWCGVEPEISHSKSNAFKKYQIYWYAKCSNKECWLHGKLANLDDWNKRIQED